MRRLPGVLPAALLLAAPLIAQDPSALAAPGISLDLARHRAATISDPRYQVSYRLPADPDSPITGTVTIAFERPGPGPLILDFAPAGEVASVAVNGHSATDYRHENGHIVIPHGAPPAGTAGTTEVTIDFIAGEGPLNRRDDFLYTLFVPDRAHEALPSFDQPDLKARFTLELTVPADWIAVANGAEVSAREGDGVVVYRFAETEPIPTYLFAFAAGRFSVEAAERDGRAMRLLHRETDADKVARNRDAIFDLHAAALRWLEEYTGIPYPFGKFDFVAVPSFQYNGMEHPGAILYRASTLFLDESATRNAELGRASVIAHETAHMWFGDLVTMPWFDDVWMKEVFANFMAAKIVNPSFPDVDHDLRFLLAHYPAAYGVDRTPGANPIRQPLDNLDDAGSLYGAIIYQKAPIVMRQLERLTGEESFRTALRRYLGDHAFGNAGWPALVAALDEVTPLDVAAWSHVWIEEPGRPTIRVVTADGLPIALRQEDPRGRDFVWDQQLTIAVAPLDDLAALDTDRSRLSMRLDRPEVGLLHPFPTDGAPPVHVLPNAAGLGYGLFVLDAATRDALLDGLHGIEEGLTRAVAWLDLWEMMLEGDVLPARMLALATRIVAAEPDELVAQEVLGDMTTLFWRYLPADARMRRAPALEDALWRRMEAVEGTSLKAAYFNAWRSVAITPPAVDRLAAVWSGELTIEGLPLSEEDRTAIALQLAIREAPESGRILDEQAVAIENPDRRARFDFIRPAVAADPAVRDSFFASLAAPGNRAREEWVVTALGLLHHPLRTGSSLDYIRPGLDLLREVHATGDIFFPTRWLAATLRGHASPEAASIVDAFIAEHPDYPPRLMGKVLQEADALFRAVDLVAGRT
ncbi:MAG TPA: M1 family aminopeptidase [Longimicrobiales bacterium]|nr:M1 family aminopeptidase [Longimicrobiales bacterium]